MKKAILQVADQGPLESLVVMLDMAGYECYLPDRQTRDFFRNLGCDNVSEIKDMVKHWGYDQPFSLPESKLSDLEKTDLFVDVKAHRNGPKIWAKMPSLRNKTLWYRINGTAPEIVKNAGDEVNLSCPIVTPDLWYKGDPSSTAYEKYYNPNIQPPGENWGGMAYACWPPFYRFSEYLSKRPRVKPPTEYSSPVCLVHNLQGWGYGALTDNFRKLGIKMYGVGSPDGLVRHNEIPELLSNSLCLVHMKSSDAPGYSLYEALSAGCPVVCTRRLIWRNNMQDLFEPGKTCIVYDRETHEGLSPEDVKKCTEEVTEALEILRDPIVNNRIGLNGHRRLKKVMWSKDRESDVLSFREFMVKHFGD